MSELRDAVRQAVLEGHFSHEMPIGAAVKRLRELLETCCAKLTPELEAEFRAELRKKLGANVYDSMEAAERGVML